MIPAISAVLLSASMFSVHTDTTTTVKPGTRLAIENFGGSVAVSTWTRNAVRIEAEHSTHSEIDIEGGESALRIVTTGRRGVPGSIDMHITMPKWMDLKVSGVYTGVSVEGSEGEVRASTVRGDLSVTGGKGFVSLESVEGDVVVRNTRARLKLSSVNQGIEVSNAQGEIHAETVNGDVMLSGITSSMIDASSVNGGICYRGSIAKDGHYHLSTHNGDVDLGLPDDVSATISVSTFSGDFDSAFRAQLFDRGGRRFNLTLGAGDAEIGLETFQGTVHLRHANEPCGGTGRRERHEMRIREKDKEKQEKDQQEQDRDTTDDEGDSQ